jgi:hypothetical protein
MGHLLTAHQQFDAIIESVQQEALAAALALGFECKSRRKLVAALKQEVVFWKDEYCWEIDCGVEDFADYPKAWSRLLCVEVIRILLEEIWEIIDTAGLDGGLEVCDEGVDVLRTRLSSAVRGPTPADARRALDECG